MGDGMDGWMGRTFIFWFFFSFENYFIYHKMTFYYRPTRPIRPTRPTRHNKSGQKAWEPGGFGEKATYRHTSKHIFL